MMPLKTIQRRLGWKLFLSYLVILIVSALVMAGTAEFLAPTTLARHIARMQAVLGNNPALAADLDRNFRAAISEILVIATVAAFLAAVAISLFTTRRIVGPVESMMHASQRIATGDYHERVHVSSEDELGALAQTFNQMAEALERTEQRRMELIGDVAHELRTPLTSIRGTMEGLLDGVLTAESATFLDVQREVARLQRLVHDLEELSRAEAGQISLDKRPLAPTDLIHTAIDRLRPQFEDKGVALHVEVDETLPGVLADSGRITQVLLNLLGNALQYTPSGGQVTLRSWHEERHLLVEVRDSGIGIAPDHLPHIFERFYRVDKSRSRAGGGSGIGLTIARHLITAHGGRLWADSPGPGRGSIFTFSLPRAC